MGLIQHLEPERIEALLSAEIVGRIACNAVGERPYLVPLAYAYDGESIYAVSGPGRKIELMQADPRISFEVDRVEASDTWQSVVAEGDYEEVTDADEIQMAVALLEGATGVPVVMGDHSIVFRLRLTAKSGRYETPNN
ncbi:MAG TPA: pyridoxamine 5'-phosphate oxidase family protein [Thermomicrobiales bacterium]|nr:pyridoxamine 5'-phosphate oxidase family protein [Thermomicrobiales bacterium]